MTLDNKINAADDSRENTESERVRRVRNVCYKRRTTGMSSEPSCFIVLIC